MEEKKYIRFVDSQYNTLFHIPDGGRIAITLSTGENLTRKCKYLGECHTEIGGNCYHICEFAERMEAAGNTIKPLDYIRDATFYPKKYLTPVGEANRPPYYVLDETPTHGFAYCPTSRTAHKYCIFEKTAEGGISDNRQFFKNFREANPAAYGFNIPKIKAVTGRPRKQKEPER